MLFINPVIYTSKKEELKARFNAQQPFRYLIIDNFLNEDKALELADAYPPPASPFWKAGIYINQKYKQEGSDFTGLPRFQQLFNELNGASMEQWLTDITGIPGLQGDTGLFGAGLHQSLKGAFLDVHIDFNVHPQTGLHRRLNLLIYLNQHWQPEYEGCLELWDMQQQKCLEKIMPVFNRCVIFETNNLSYHGHPVPLNVPVDITRKSIATYYYAADPPAGSNTQPHETIFKNTQGTRGIFKNLIAGLQAFKQRILGG